MDGRLDVAALDPQGRVREAVLVGPLGEERPPFGLVVGDVKAKVTSPPNSACNIRDCAGQVRGRTAGGRHEDPRGVEPAVAEHEEVGGERVRQLVDGGLGAPRRPGGPRPSPSP